MRILIAMNLPYVRSHGGANRTVRALAEGLAERNHEVLVVAPVLASPSRTTRVDVLRKLAGDGVVVVTRDGIDTFQLAGVRVHSVPEAERLRVCLSRMLEDGLPDIVIVSSEDQSQSLLEVAVKACPERTLYLALTPPLFPFGPASLYPGTARTGLVRSARAVVTISDFARDYIRRWGGMEAEVIHVPHFGKPPYPLLASPENPYVLLMNACEIKGLGIFLGLCSAFPSVRFAALPGYGTTAADLRRLQEFPNVEVLENFESLDDLFRKVRVLVMPSLWVESFGMAVVDAMLRGIPVMASDFGGLVEAKLGAGYLLPVSPIQRFERRLDENLLPVPVVPAQDLGPWVEGLKALLFDSDNYLRQSAISRRAALGFVGGLSVGPFEALFERLRAGRSRQIGLNRPDLPELASVSAEGSQPLPAGIERLSPAQRALLMRRLAGKGAAPERIPSRADRSRSPLSAAQERLWFLEQLQPGRTDYHLGGGVRLRGRVDLRVLERAIAVVVQRHDTLRSAVCVVDEAPVMELRPGLLRALELVDLRGLGQSQREKLLRRLAREEMETPFDFSKGPLLRVRLFRVEAESHAAVVVLHHLIADGASVEVFLREFVEVYRALVSVQLPRLDDLPIQFGDFAAWQRALLGGAGSAQSQEFWRGYLANPGAPIQLPTDRPRPARGSSRGGSCKVVIGAEQERILRELGRRCGATMFMTLLAAFNSFLHRYTSQEDVIVGIPTSARRHAETESLIGMFVTVLPQRCRLRGGMTFTEAILATRESVLQVHAHQEFPVEAAVRHAEHGGASDPEPLIRVGFSLGAAFEMEAQAGSISVESFGLHEPASHFDLTLDLVERAGRVEGGRLGYAMDLFDAGTARRIADSFMAFLEILVRHPNQPLERASVVTENEAARLLVEFAGAIDARPQSLFIHDLIVDQAGTAPDRVAVDFDSIQVSYGRLGALTGEVSALLRRHGVGPETVVGIFMDRSVELVAGILSILRAGAAYLPLDPEYPRDRLRFMAESSGVDVILTQARHMRECSGFADRVIALDDWLASPREKAVPLVVPPVLLPANPAYVIYTSGSTGRPKGVVNTHEGLLNRILWMQEAFNISGRDHVLQKTSIGFDVSVWEFLWPLAFGARLVVALPGGHRDSAYLVGAVQSNAVTTLHFVPSMLGAVLEEQGIERCRSLRNLICSGEALPMESVRLFQRKLSGAISNLYGPTEAAIDVTCWRCPGGDRRAVVPIGRPIANCEAHVLDKARGLTPTGVHGELHLGGLCLARGYLGRPDLTAERFVPNPFARPPGSRLYCTGDLCRWTAEGVLEFAGRLDNQVKIRGQRIEVREVESVLMEHELVSEARVMAARRGGAEVQLIAFVVPSPGWKRSLKVTVPADSGALAPQVGSSSPSGGAAAEPYPKVFRDLGVEWSTMRVVVDVGGGDGVLDRMFRANSLAPRIYIMEPSAERIAALSRGENLVLVHCRASDAGDGRVVSRTISELMVGERLGRIDLLRIGPDQDAESALRGLAGEHWSRIGCILVEGAGGQARALVHAGAHGWLVTARHPLLGEGAWSAVNPAPVAEHGAPGAPPGMLDGLEADALRVELRRHAAGRVPSYMIPDTIEIVVSLPLTPNGKVDRALLLGSVRSRAAKAKLHVPPRSPVESQLASIWRELLQVEQVGAFDHFFELGGHSLLLTRLASRIGRDFGVDLPLRTLLDSPSLEAMSSNIVAAAAGEFGEEAMAIVDELRGGTAASAEVAKGVDACGGPVSEWSATPKPQA